MSVREGVKRIFEESRFVYFELFKHHPDVAAVRDVAFATAGDEYFDAEFFIFLQ